MAKPANGPYNLGAPAGGNGTGWKVVVDDGGMHVPLHPASGNYMTWVPGLNRFVRETPSEPEFWIRWDYPTVGQYSAKYGDSTYTGPIT